VSVWSTGWTTTSCARPWWTWRTGGRRVIQVHREFRLQRESIETRRVAVERRQLDGHPSLLSNPTSQSLLADGHRPGGPRHHLRPGDRGQHRRAHAGSGRQRAGSSCPGRRSRGPVRRPTRSRPPPMTPWSRTRAPSGSTRSPSPCPSPTRSVPARWPMSSGSSRSWVLLALLLAVIVAATVAARFTAPLRRLTEASTGHRQGRLQPARTGQPRPDGCRPRSPSCHAQFNAMAAQLGESVDIIRRDRDRSRDFLADVSHELRTPIAAMRTFNELLREGASDDPEAREEFLESSRQQLERLELAGAEPAGPLEARFGARAPGPASGRPARLAVEAAVEQAEPVAARRGNRPGARLDARADRHPPRCAADRAGGHESHRQLAQVSPSAAARVDVKVRPKPRKAPRSR